MGDLLKNGNGSINIEKIKELADKQGVLEINGADSKVVEKYKKILFENITDSKNLTEDGDLKIMTDEQLSYLLKNSQKDALRSFNVFNKVSSGSSDIVKNFSTSVGIQKIAEKFDIAPEAVLSSFITTLVLSVVSCLSVAGMKVATLLQNKKEKKEKIKTIVEAQVKQENALKAQQASVYMGTELSPSTQTETVNAR